MPNRNENDERMMGAADREAGRGGASGQQGGRRSNRGFASMDRGKQKEIASKGGKAAHAKGTAHEFDSNEAREAGRKGGLAVSRNREHMAAIGRRGGEARGQARGRGAAQANSEGSFQNSRAGVSDREVTPPAQSDDSLNASTQGNRGGNSSLGGERRSGQGIAGETGQSTSGERDSFGNH